jgi:hypothetical protein
LSSMIRNSERCAPPPVLPPGHRIVIRGSGARSR